MRRRLFNKVLGAGVVGASMAGATRRLAFAGPDASQLGKTLTPLGAEMAGNAAGTIPAWTGGMTSIPAGINWDPNATLPPDFWADEQPLYTVDASNLSTYAALLSDGAKLAVQTKGMVMHVYPTHRTAAAPQWVYDNTAANVSRAELLPQGGRFGFTGAFDGIPFPILDTANPLNGGAQAVWNHECRWQGSFISSASGCYVMENGTLTLTNGNRLLEDVPFYAQNANAKTSTLVFRLYDATFAPSQAAGGAIIGWYSINTQSQPDTTWQLLAGQGRVRKAPEVEYDTPANQLNGQVNYDEFYGFIGALEEYDWHLVGKQEMLIPYNNNKLTNTPADVMFSPQFVNPDVMRWELHRCWVVKATLAAGRRNVLATRTFYIDEDTWTIAVGDAYDANGTLFHTVQTVNTVFPNLPGTVCTNSFVFNVQTNVYGGTGGPYGNAPFNAPWLFKPLSASNFNPANLAATANY